METRLNEASFQSGLRLSLPKLVTASLDKLLMTLMGKLRPRQVSPQGFCLTTLGSLSRKTSLRPLSAPTEGSVPDRRAELLGRAVWQDGGVWRPTLGQSPHCAQQWGPRPTGRAVCGPEPGQEGWQWVDRSLLWPSQSLGGLGRTGGREPV